MGTIISYHCDVCKIVLKKGDKKFFFAYQSLEQETDNKASDQYKSFLKGMGKEEDVYSIYNNRYHFEICAKCYSVIANALASRIEEVKKEIHKLDTAYIIEQELESEEENNES